MVFEDKGRPRKQRHTAKRIFERIRDECGFDGGYTIVKDYVRSKKRGSRKMFVLLSHPPGHAQADFGEALVVIGGVEQKAYFFALDPPHSDACYVRAYAGSIRTASARYWYGSLEGWQARQRARRNCRQIFSDTTSLSNATAPLAALPSPDAIHDPYGRLL
jgi:hypothetical protein